MGLCAHGHHAASCHASAPGRHVPPGASQPLPPLSSQCFAHALQGAPQAGGGAWPSGSRVSSGPGYAAQAIRLSVRQLAWGGGRILWCGQPELGACEPCNLRVDCVPATDLHPCSGVIVGWDTECCQTEAWMRQMGVDRLPGAPPAVCVYPLLCRSWHKRPHASSPSPTLCLKGPCISVQAAAASPSTGCCRTQKSARAGRRTWRRKTSSWSRCLPCTGTSPATRCTPSAAATSLRWRRGARATCPARGCATATPMTSGAAAGHPLACAMWAWPPIVLAGLKRFTCCCTEQTNSQSTPCARISVHTQPT